MATEIKCPNCGHPFPMEDAVSEDYKRELREKMTRYIKQKDEELQKKQEEFLRREQTMLQQAQQKELEYANKLADEKAKLQKSLEENIRKSISADFENQVSLLQQTNKDNEIKLQEARSKQLEYLKKEQELQNREQEMEIQIQQTLLKERQKIGEEIRKLEEQRTSAKETEYQLRMKEMEKQLEDQKKLVDEMKRKAEQGSMQMQGEVQELLLENLLRGSFPFDVITEVSKGARGADCIQTIRNQFGQECGKIIYESKRAQHFANDWIEKLKAEMRTQGADVAVIVTQAMPKDMNQFGEKNGVWICSFAEVRALAHILRDSIIKIYNASRSQENKGDKMHLLYDYLTGQEFAEQWKAIREGFLSMRLSIQKERDAMEKLWKAREKHLEKVLLNAAHIRGSIEGIAGQDSIDLNLLEDDDKDNLLGG
ncbi:DUF2130 domain-containing protein [Agriterribacter sp.]|uniref:DUF2130 domain-containing protein n=1 Tax=Agriterribacter sp. TaxID=2821509 RepID=UPI002C9A8FE8|nr:DUF2130 domain-containing protein [Agriterribacter sp.]HRO46707.1 DUF2130 domain-containing protein [Agriterribacter sp.]HRQ18895.1 DUF2130 domain-containing protein [Agriterribacter sp.]